MAHHGLEVTENSLYEGDQSKLYSGVYNHHKTESVHSDESKKQIKRIWMITLYLTIITIIEVTFGLWDHHTGMFNRGILNAFFLILTVFKAYLIVDVFMHLGDEVRHFVMAILIPLTLFSWFIIAFLADGQFSLKMNETQAGTRVKTEVIHNK